MLLSRRRIVALLLAAAAVGWVLVDRPIEGAVIWTVARGHGLTVADLAAAPALCAALWFWLTG
jgi:hypothetical protein